MIRIVALLTAFAFSALALAAPVPRERVPPDDKAIKKRFYDCWHEEWREECFEDGRVNVETRPSVLMGYYFSENGGWTWEWSGQLSPVEGQPIQLDTTHTPMRFDILGTGPADKPRHVAPGIFKFEGARLILAYSRKDGIKWNATGEYPERPKDFERRPGVTIAVLERCEYLEQYCAPECVPKRP